MPFFLTHAGCGSPCSFCDQAIMTSVSSGLENALDDFRKRALSQRLPPREIGLYGGDILNLPPAEMVRLLDDVARFVTDEFGSLPALRVSASPRSISRRKLSLLEQYNVQVIEVGAVSTSEEVLRACRRGYAAGRVTEAVSLAKDMGFEVGVQFITGLPMDTIQDFSRTLSDVFQLQPHFAILYPLVILGGTELGLDYRSGRYLPPGRGYIVRTAVLFLLSCKVWNVTVGRIGLHESDMDGSAVLYHSFSGNLRQAAEGELYRLMVAYLLLKFPGTVTVHFNKRRETSVRGKKGENLRKILSAHPHLSGRLFFDHQRGEVVGRGKCGKQYEVKGGERDFFAFARYTLMERERL